MISILGLTDTDEIRSAIGVEEVELSDKDITNRRPQQDLEADLMAWVPTYPTVISEGTAALPTDEQKLKYLQLKLYSKYFVSFLTASAGLNSILQKRSDGSNEAIRFTNVKMTELKNELASFRDDAKSQLIDLITPTTEDTYSQFGIVSPSYDPVTNDQS